MTERGPDVDDDRSVLEFPDLEERLGEQIVNTAAQVLHRDLLQTGPVEDDLIVSRVRGIDSPAELAAYRAVETRSRNRDRVHELLDDRADWLKSHGFRPNDLIAALLDQDADLPERYSVRVPLWVSTYDLREKPEVDRSTGRTSSPKRSTSSPPAPSSSSRTTQVTLATDGGVGQ